MSKPYYEEVNSADRELWAVVLESGLGSGEYEIVVSREESAVVTLGVSFVSVGEPHVGS
jgi:hypothetical protein